MSDTGLFSGGPMRELTGEEQHALDTMFSEHTNPAELARLRAIEAAARELMFLFVESDIPEHNRPKAAALRAALEARS